MASKGSPDRRQDRAVTAGIGAGYDRRRFLQIGGGAALTAMLVGCGKTNVSGGNASAGGGGGGAADSILWATNESYGRPNMLSPFTKETGIKVQIEVNDDPAAVTSKLQTGGTGISGYTDGTYHARTAFEAGLLEPIDMANVPNYETNLLTAFKDAPAHIFDGKVYGIPQSWGTDSVAYNADKIQGKIDDIGALWDPAYKGKIAMPSGLFESVIVAGIYAEVDDPFTMSDDELKKVKELLIKQKPLLRTYWKQIGDLTNLFASGEVYIAWSWVPVMELRKKADMNMVWVLPKQGQLGWYDSNFVTKDATPEKKKAFEQFANYTIGDTYGVVLGEEIGYRTLSKPAIAKLPKDLRTELNLDDPDKFLEGVNYWLAPDRPKAYQAVMDDVLNA